MCRACGGSIAKGQQHQQRHMKLALVQFLPITPGSNKRPERILLPKCSIHFGQWFSFGFNNDRQHKLNLQLYYIQ